MILTSGSFEQVADFAARFCEDSDPVTFSNGSGGMLRVQVKGENGYGCIEVNAVSGSLGGRFTVSFECLDDISAELGDECYIQITPCSSAKFMTDHMEWWLDYRNDHVEVPRVKQETVMHWDESFSDILTRVSHACTDDSQNGVLDSVHVETSKRASSMVATDGGLIVAHDNRWRLSEEEDVDDLEDDPVSVLIRKKHVPIIRKVCEAGNSVSIHIGISNVMVRSGRRSATIPRKGGRFPRWRNSVRDGSKGRVYGFMGMYCDKVSEAVDAVRMVDDYSTIHPHRDGIAMRSENDCGEFAEAVMDAEWGDELGNLTIRTEYLKKVAAAWPEPDFKISYRGDDLPLEVGSIFFQSPMVAMIMPAINKKEESTEVSEDDKE